MNPQTTLENTQVGPGMNTLYGNQPSSLTPPPVNTSYVLGLPQKSPTKTTGVASSGLADDTLATQQQGLTSVLGAMDAQQQNTAATPTFNPQASVSDLLTSMGKPGDFNSRATLAQQAGIQHYVGSSQQNLQLMGWINNGGMQAQAGAAPVQTGGAPTQGGTQTATPTGSATGQTQQPNPNAMPGDVYNQQLSDIQKQYGTALDDWNSQVAQIRNGSFPLTASQQASVDATQQQFNQTIEQQMIANANYAKMVENAQFRNGTNLTDPSEFAAKNHLIISDGLAKITNLQATAAKTVADLKQGFMDKDYTMINDSYDKLVGTLDKINQSTQSLQKTANDNYRDVRDYNQKVYEFQQKQTLDEKRYEMDLEKSRVEIQKLKSDMTLAAQKANGTGTLDVNNPFAKQIKNAMAAIKFPTLGERDQASQAIMSMVAEGDIEGAQSQLRQYAFNSMPVATQTTLAGKDAAIASLDRVEQGLANLKAAGVSTNFLTGLKQKSLQKGGFLADPTLNAVAEEVALGIIDYRHAVSGAAFTAQEAKDYERLFPSTGNTPALNAVQISTLKNKFQSDIDQAYDSRISNYKQINESLDAYRANPAGLSGASSEEIDPAGLY